MAPDRFIAILLLLIVAAPMLKPMAMLSYDSVRLMFKGDEIDRCLHRFGNYTTAGHNVICADIYR